MSNRFVGVRSAVKNSAFLFATQAASIAIRFAYLFVLARILSPARYGALNYALSWYLLVLPLTYLGADVILSREVGLSRERASSLLGATLGMRLIAAFLVTLGLLVTISLFVDDPSLSTLVALFSCALVGRSLWMWSASVFTAFEETRFTLRFEVITRLLELTAVVIVVRLLGPDLYKIAIVHACSWLLQGTAATLLVFRRYEPRIHLPRLQWLQLLATGFPGAAFSISTAAFFQLPIILFGQIIGTGNSLGYFALAFQVITYLVGIPTVIASASLPVLSRSAARGDGKDRIAAVILAAATVVGGLGLVLAASLVGRPVVTFLFGERYAGAALVLQHSLWLLPLASIAMLLQNVLFSNDVRSLGAKFGPLVGLAVMIGLFPTLTQSRGYVGALICLAAGLALWIVFASIESFRMGFFKMRTARLRLN